MMCCYYPTTTIAIDDDNDFLGVLTQNLGMKDCIPYLSPKKAIGTLKSQNPFQRIHDRIIKISRPADSHSTPEDQSIIYSIRGLHEEIYSSDRFNDVSVIIVDYYMNELNGIDVCEALSKHPAKKILLTGGADKESLAIDAFNKGVIHRFISKADANFPSKIKQAVIACKEAYFRDLTASLIPHFSSMPTNLYQYSPYVNFARNLQDQCNAVEHYIVDENGSSLMLDADGNPSWFIIKRETEMKNLKKLARDQGAPRHLIRGIEERLLIPFFLSDDDYRQPVSEWKRFFYPGQALQHVKDYYYAIYNGSRNNHINTDKIVSYQSHLNSVRA